MSDGGMEAKFESLAGVLASDHRALMDACWRLETMGDASTLLTMITLDLGRPAQS
jgi:hypothetical protein